MASPAMTDELCEQTAALYLKHGNKQRAADEAGIARNTFCSRLNTASARGFLGPARAKPGFVFKSISSKEGDTWVKQVPEPGEEFEVPEGHVVKGVSVLVDADGRTRQQWIKTREGIDPRSLIDTIKTAFDGFEGHAKPVPAPVAADAYLLNLLPCNDWHTGVYIWGDEASENWDLAKAERVIGQSVEDVVWRSPSAGTCIVLGGGDLMHSDTNDNRTANSGNALDVDGRHQKVLGATCRLMVRTIDAALHRNDKVVVRILPGNHDPYSSVAIAYFLLAWYRAEPRVAVDVDPSLFFWHRFGLVLIGSTHGHTVKAGQMASIMAHRRAEDWGQTKYRYVHTFHLHHSAKTATEGNGVITETHQAPVPQDAWHFGSGFLSGRSLQTITYHSMFGEISRCRVAIMDAPD